MEFEQLLEESKVGGGKKLDRQKTRFVSELFDYLKDKSTNLSNLNFLKYYQNIDKAFLTDVDTDSRGLLVCLMMGMGKSMVAISAAYDCLNPEGETKKVYKPIILASKSLQENMRQTIRKYIKLRGVEDPHFAPAKLPQDDLERHIDKNFSFVTMNAINMYKQLTYATQSEMEKKLNASYNKAYGDIVEQEANLEGRFLIVDEAHNLFRAITNGSKNAIALYELIMSTRDMKIMFLTGTPITNDPYELSPCFNMLGSKTGKSVLPDNYTDFNTYFVGQDGNIKNKEIFQNRLFGLVSYVDVHSRIGQALGESFAKSIGGTKIEFPEEKPTKIRYVHLSGQQWVYYQLAREREHQEDVKKSKAKAKGQHYISKPKSSGTSSYRVRSRQLSNFCPLGANGENSATSANNTTEMTTDIKKITSWSSPKFEAMLEDIDAQQGELSIAYSQFTQLGGLLAFRNFLLSRGWEEYTPTVELYRKKPAVEVVGSETVGSKTAEIAKAEAEITEADEIKIAETDAFTDLKNVKIGSAKAEEKPPQKPSARTTRKFAYITGETVVESRTAIVNVFTDPDNKHGGKIDLLLLSASGSEGLDLKCVRHAMMMEPFFNDSRFRQFKSRAIRNDSHISLPPEERNVVPYIYIALPPKSELPEKYKNFAASREELLASKDIVKMFNADEDISPKETPEHIISTDLELYVKSIKTANSLDSFMSAIREVSIECLLNVEENCRTCQASDDPLYTFDVEKDIMSPNMCIPSNEQKVKVKKVVVGDETFYVSRGSDGVRVYRQKGSKYVELKPGDDLYKEIHEKLNKI